MNKFTKNVLLIGAALTAYGYLCRIVGLYFFWEGKYVGWAIVLIGTISFLINQIKIKKTQKQKTILEKIGIGILIFVLLVQVVVLTVIPNSDAYKVAKLYLRNDLEIKNEIGDVEDFSLTPFSGLQINSINDKEWGNANINVTVKGRLKYKDINILLVKNPETQWTVYKIEK